MKTWLEAMISICSVAMLIAFCFVPSSVSLNIGNNHPTLADKHNTVNKHQSAEQKNKKQKHSLHQQVSNKNENTGGRTEQPHSHMKQKSRKRNSGSDKTDKPILKETIKVTAKGEHVVTNPGSILVCANKHRSLGKYVPKDLVIPDIPFPYGKNAKLEKMHLRSVAAGPIEDLFLAAKKDGIDLVGISGYRSYDYQVEVFARNVSQYGGDEKKANQVSAHPGQSEHQTGLTMDVSTQAMGFKLSQKFGETKAGKWLADNAWKYGYIIRYLKGKQNITGYEYEPWHIRYVGKKAARIIMAEGITLEDYLK